MLASSYINYVLSPVYSAYRAPQNTNYITVKEREKNTVLIYLDSDVVTLQEMVGILSYMNMKLRSFLDMTPCVLVDEQHSFR
jgi:hypothetical protein